MQKSTGISAFQNSPVMRFANEKNVPISVREDFYFPFRSFERVVIFLYTSNKNVFEVLGFA